MSPNTISRVTGMVSERTFRFQLGRCIVFKIEKGRIKLLENLSLTIVNEDLFAFIYRPKSVRAHEIFLYSTDALGGVFRRTRVVVKLIAFSLFRPERKM